MVNGTLNEKNEIKFKLKRISSADIRFIFVSVYIFILKKVISFRFVFFGWERKTKQNISFSDAIRFN